MTYGQCFSLGKCFIGAIQVICIGMTYFRKKSRGIEDIIFWKKTVDFFWFFFCCPGNSKQNYVCYIPRKFQGQKPRPLEISHEFFLGSPGNSTLCLINPWKFCMRFFEYSCKFYIINPPPLPLPHPVWIFPRITQSRRPCASLNTVL